MPPFGDELSVELMTVRSSRARTAIRTVATPLSFRTDGGTLGVAEQGPATARLLERSEGLARIESASAEARSGRGTFLVLEGPAGIGKTALLAAARTAAAESGMLVLRARGTELERDFV